MQAIDISSRGLPAWSYRKSTTYKPYWKLMSTDINMITSDTQKPTIQNMNFVFLVFNDRKFNNKESTKKDKKALQNNQ